MDKISSQSTTAVELPVSLEQLAVGIRKLSRSNLLTLELMLDEKAMRTMKSSLRDTARGKVKPFQAD